MKRKIHWNGPDYLKDKRASEQLVKNIRKWWRRRGVEVEVRIESEFYRGTESQRRSMFVIRSNIIPKLPRQEI